ncbi:MAG: birA, biotin-(acetyl-CoA-carboxylase) ligase [Acidimicrobiales bacterium]|nr:birA, biotin-(acetyl-CoA-carboxylase) ligase [Acidimicrobiales bacterium]
MLGPVETVDEIDSTNRELLRRAAAGDAEGVVLVARHQTDGRGRLDRRWEAPPGASILVSVLLRPDLPVEQLHLVTFAAGLAAVAASHAGAGVRLGLKWPNDVVVDGPDGARKVAGLLAEGHVQGGRVDALVVGMGLNVNWSTPVPGDGAALNQLAGGAVDAGAVLDAWLADLEARYRSLADGRGRAEVVEDYRRACTTLGRRVRVELPDGDVEGDAVDVDELGRLVVDTPARRSFAVGDVVHLRSFPAAGAEGRL